jgi:hypothetical protein
MVGSRVVSFDVTLYPSLQTRVAESAKKGTNYLPRSKAFESILVVVRYQKPNQNKK